MRLIISMAIAFIVGAVGFSSIAAASSPDAPVKPEPGTPPVVHGGTNCSDDAFTLNMQATMTPDGYVDHRDIWGDSDHIMLKFLRVNTPGTATDHLDRTVFAPVADGPKMVHICRGQAGFYSRTYSGERYNSPPLGMAFDPFFNNLVADVHWMTVRAAYYASPPGTCEVDWDIVHSKPAGDTRCIRIKLTRRKWHYKLLKKGYRWRKLNEWTTGTNQNGDRRVRRGAFKSRAGHTWHNRLISFTAVAVKK